MEAAAVRTISHYSSDMDILLVGEGDFSFAAALARAFQHAPRLLVATSLDSREMLHNNYGWLMIEPRLVELSLRGALVMNEVDVKTIQQHGALSHLSFDRIIYNFPHSGFVSGLREYQNALIWKHRKLMRSFFKNIRRMLKVGGEVHVTHHMCKPYSEWRLQEEAAKSGLELQACYEFEPQVFPGYTPRRGAGANANGSFPLHNPVTFIFILPYSPPPPIPCHPPPRPPCIISPNPSPCPSSIIPCPPFITSPTLHHPRPRPCPRPFNNITPPPSPPRPIHPPPTTIKTPNPSITISSPPPPPPSSPITISTHPHYHKSINSHENPYIKPLPRPLNMPSQHHSSDHHVKTESFPWVSVMMKIIKFFTDPT